MLDGGGWLHQGQGHCIQMSKLHDTRREKKKSKTEKNEKSVKKLTALRESQLSPGKMRLASREILVDLAAPRLYQDLPYAVQLYDVFEWRRFLGRLDCCSSGKEDEDYICF